MHPVGLQRDLRLRLCFLLLHVVVDLVAALRRDAARGATFIGAPDVVAAGVVDAALDAALEEALGTEVLVAGVVEVPEADDRRGEDEAVGRIERPEEEEAVVADLVAQNVGLRQVALAEDRLGLALDVEVAVGNEARLVLEHLRVQSNDTVEPFGEERAGDAVNRSQLVL